MQMNPTESRKQCSISRYAFVLSGISRALPQSEGTNHRQGKMCHLQSQQQKQS